MQIGRSPGKLGHRLGRQVADILADKIIAGEFREESLLPSERELCQTLGVSRTVVREAVKSLESRGLVRVEHGRGSVVQAPHYGPLSDALKMLLRRRKHLVADLLELRKVLEIYMVMRAAERRTESNLAAMERYLEKMSESPDEPEGYINADLEFHMEIARATQNPVLLVLLEPVSELSRESRARSFSGPRMVKLRARQHREILNCIRIKDVAGAEAAMRKHLLDTERDLRRREKSLGTLLSTGMISRSY